MDDRHRAIRAWLAGELARLSPGAGWRSAATPGATAKGYPAWGGEASGAATMLPVAELVDLIACLEAGACVDGCALIDADACGDGCLLADEPGPWEVTR
jgi:hypothetical protein